VTDVETFLARCERIRGEVTCDPFGFSLEALGDHVVLRSSLVRQDTYSREWGTGYSGPFLLTADMSDDVIAKRFYVAAASHAEHEVREAFLWRSKPVLGPHVPLRLLWEVLG
jgi:hypothetical protein